MPKELATQSTVLIEDLTRPKDVALPFSGLGIAGIATLYASSLILFFLGIFGDNGTLVPFFLYIAVITVGLYFPSANSLKKYAKRLSYSRSKTLNKALRNNSLSGLSLESYEAVDKVVDGATLSARFSPFTHVFPLGTTVDKQFDPHFINTVYGDGALEEFLVERNHEYACSCAECTFSYWQEDDYMTYEKFQKRHRDHNCNLLSEAKSYALECKFPKACVASEVVSHSLVVGRGKVILKSETLSSKGSQFDKTLDKISALV